MTTGKEPGPTGGLWAREGMRALAVVGGALAALVVWVIADPLAGVDLEASLGGDGPPDVIDAGAVIVTTVAAGLAAWILLEILERTTRRPRLVWLRVAIIVLALSLLGPLFGGGSGAATIVLACLHLAFAAVLIPVMARTV